MKEIPILFSTPMVQAILEGRKSQTRRQIKPQAMVDEKGRLIWKNAPAGKTKEIEKGLPISYGLKDYCPYGRPGDLLWARETFRKYCKVDEFGYTRYDQEVIEFAADNPPMINECDGDGCTMFKKDGTEKFISWRPSIFLPKEAARIWLQVTDVRVERLQDISEEDAKAEGVEKIDDSIFCWRHYGGKYAGCSTARNSFQSIWKSINGDESWNINPWVWVISFNILSTSGKPK